MLSDRILRGSPACSSGGRSGHRQPSAFRPKDAFPACRALRGQRPAPQRLAVRTHAAHSNGAPAPDFNLSEYFEARVETVRHTDKYGHVLFLKILDGQESVLPVYIGDFECTALVTEINKRQPARPLTHDLMKSTLELLGFRVTKVRVNALVGNTYHARVHYTRAPAVEGGAFEEVDVDARPSDAINLAVRFSAPIYVCKAVANKMAGALTPAEVKQVGSAARGGSRVQESASEIQRSCRQEVLSYTDPTVMHKVQLEVAIAEERYADAAALRDQIDQIMTSDRCLSLVVAMETALEDQRYEEAAKLRDEFRRLQELRSQQPKAQAVQAAPQQAQKEVQDI